MGPDKDVRDLNIRNYLNLTELDFISLYCVVVCYFLDRVFTRYILVCHLGV